MTDRIPVKIRTARKRYPCNDCELPVEPGEKYELAVFPPHSVDVYDVPHWLAWRSHYPRRTENAFRVGCDLSAAYREKAARERGEGANIA